MIWSQQPGVLAFVATIRVEFTFLREIAQLANPTVHGFFFTLETKGKLLAPNVAIPPSVTPFTKFADNNIGVLKFDIRQAHRADGL